MHHTFKHLQLIVLLQSILLSFHHIVDCNEIITNIQTKNNESQSHDDYHHHHHNFPSLKDTDTLIHLSKDVYKVDTKESCKEYHYKEDEDIDIKCIYQQKVKKYGTNVMIVTSKKLNFIGVIFAGTDSYDDVVNADADIRLVPFGPKDEPIDQNIMVHNGFNNGVFGHGIFSNLLENVQSFLTKNKNYRLCTAGHSLGGSQSALTAVAFSQYFPDRFIQHISIGEPMSGDDSWVTYVNNNPNLSIWRFVYELDLVSRMCGEKHFTYRHIGHTVQLDSKHCAKAYYQHHGSDEHGYKGVPSNWESHAMKSFTLAAADHLSINYKWYMEHRAFKDSKCNFVDHFEKIEDDDITTYAIQ